MKKIGFIMLFFAIANAFGADGNVCLINKSDANIGVIVNVGICPGVSASPGQIQCRATCPDVVASFRLEDNDTGNYICGGYFLNSYKFPTFTVTGSGGNYSCSYTGG